MKIAYVIYPDFTALDLIGPYEVISLWPDVELHWVATTTGPISQRPRAHVLPTTTPAQLPDPDVVVIPGSSKPLGPLDDEVLLDWVRQVAPTAHVARLRLHGLRASTAPRACWPAAAPRPTGASARA